MSKTLIALSAAALLATAAQAQVRITEWMYSGADGEYIELTNTGAAAVSLANYSFDDDSATPGIVSLASLGTLQPGQSLIITESTAAFFRTAWNLPANVLVYGENSTNLGRADTINIFDGNTLVDSLAFGDVAIPGTIRTQNRSGITLAANWGTNNVAGWFFATVGDSYGTYTSAGGDIGNPGIIPSPGAAAVLGMGLIAAGRRRR